MRLYWGVMVLAREEELLKAQAEAWSKTHYRLDWLLSRTLGYAILSSALAIYVFWAEAGRDHPAEVTFGLAGTWMLLLALAMLWYDFNTRVSYENWTEVRRRLLRHIWVSILSFVVALGFAYGIHGLAALIDNVTPDPNAIAASQPKVHVPGAPTLIQPIHKNGKRAISNNQGAERRAALAAADKAAGAKKANAKGTPAKSAPAKGPAKTPVKNPAKPAAKAAPVKKAPAKAAPKKHTQAPVVHHKKKLVEYQPPVHRKKKHRRIF